MPRGIRFLSAIAVTFALITAAIALQQPPTKTDSPTEPLPTVKLGPKYWKGNLHTHSLWSDGDDFPEMIADWYRRNGYDFLGLSDHNILSDGEKWIEVTKAREVAVKKYQQRFGSTWVEQRVEKEKPQVRLKPLAEFRSHLEEAGRFLLIPSEEITHKFGKNPVHMNGINVRDVIQPINGKDVAETIRVNVRQVAAQAKKTGWTNLVFLNHPNFGWGVKAEDMIVAEELRFFEVYNGHPGVKNYGDTYHASTERMWDIVLAFRLERLKQQLLYGMGTDDSHSYHKVDGKASNPGRGWVMVRSPFLSAESLVRAMHAGDFYISSGVTLTDVHADAKGIRLNIAAQPGVKYKTEFIATPRGVSLEGEVYLDKDQKPMDVTRRYSQDVGKVVAVSDDVDPSYKFTGSELYVRARVTSSRAHSNPFQKGDPEMAWTQPVQPARP